MLEGSTRTASSGTAGQPPPPPMPNSIGLQQDVAPRPPNVLTQTWSNPIAAHSIDVMNTNNKRIADLHTQIEELNSANRKLAIQAAHHQHIEPELARFRESEPELKRLRVQVDELNLQVVNLKDRIKDGNRVAESRSN